MAERFKNTRQIIFAHANARVFYREAEVTLPVELRSALDDKSYIAARVRELDRITQDIYQHLFKLSVVADVIFADVAFEFAIIG